MPRYAAEATLLKEATTEHGVACQMY